MRPLIPACLVLALVIPCAGGVTPGPSGCTDTPLGLLCVADETGDGHPDRVHLYNHDPYAPLTFDARAGTAHDGAEARVSSPRAGGGALQASAGAGEQPHSHGDHPARREARVHAVTPWQDGGLIVVAVYDRNGSGIPNGVDVRWWSSWSGDGGIRQPLLG